MKNTILKNKILLITSILIASLHAEDDPFRKGDGKIYGNNSDQFVEDAVSEEWKPNNLSICYEAFSLPLALAAQFQRENLADAALYAKIVAELGKDTVRQESLIISRALSGQKVTNQSISELIYPTEFGPATINNTVQANAESNGESGKNPTAKAGEPGITSPMIAVTGVRAPALPIAFDTRNTGTTMEMESMLGEENKYLDLRVSVEHVTLSGRSTWGQEISAVEMPDFETQRIHASSTLRLDQPFLLGTISRSPVSKVDPDSSNRVWYAFVTGTLAK